MELAYDQPRGLDPADGKRANRASDVQYFSALYDALAYEDPNSGEVKMLIADSLSSPDAVHWTLKIKPNVRFSDGTAFDAAAVKYNWEHIGDPAAASVNAAAVRQIAELAVTDPLTLAVTLKAPNGQFPRVVAKMLPYVGSPTAMQAEGAGFRTKPVGAGPFVLDSWTRDSEMRLKRNPDYWQKDKGLPYLDQLTIRLVPDQEQRYNSFVAGEAQVTEGGPNPVYGKRAVDDGYGTIAYRPSGGLQIVFNTARAPFDDVRVRTAVAKGLDLATLAQATTQGAGEVPTTFFADTSPFVEPDIQLASAVRDPAAAQRLFDAYAAEHGGTVALELTTSTIQQQPFELIQAQLNQFTNVKATLRVVDPTQLQKIYAQKDFQAGLYGLIAIDPEPEMYDQYHTGGSANFSGISDPALDQALDQGRATLDQAQRKTAYDAAQKRLAQLVPDVIYQRYTQFAIYAGTVHGLTYPNVGPLWADVWLSK